MEKEFFGICDKGAVDLITLRDGAGMTARIITLGAALQSLELDAPCGKRLDVVWGLEDAQSYLKVMYGAAVGRVANRIAGGRFSLNGRDYQIPPNQGNNALHGGPDGFTRRIFTPVEYNPRRVGFRLFSPDGDQGFPGNMEFELIYSLETPGILALEYRAVSDRDTLISPTNHSYFNLDGHGAGSVDGEWIRLNSFAYTPLDEHMIPTGELVPTEGGPQDLSRPRRIGEINDLPEFAATKGLDTNFCLREGCRDLSAPAAAVYAPESGLVMECYTDRPGIQLYCCGGIKDRLGKGGALYGHHRAICLETQAYPDAVHHEQFPSTLLKAGDTFVSRTRYCFRGLRPGEPFDFKEE